MLKNNFEMVEFLLENKALELAKRRVYQKRQLSSKHGSRKDLKRSSREKETRKSRKDKEKEVGIGIEVNKEELINQYL